MHHNGEHITIMMINGASTERNSIHCGCFMKQDRLTITLGKGQRKALKGIAVKRRTSLATVIRWALDHFIGGDELSTKSPENRKREPKAH